MRHHSGTLSRRMRHRQGWGSLLQGMDWLAHKPGSGKILHLWQRKHRLHTRCAATLHLVRSGGIHLFSRLPPSACRLWRLHRAPPFRHSMARFHWSGWIHRPDAASISSWIPEAVRGLPGSWNKLVNLRQRRSGQKVWRSCHATFQTSFSPRPYLEQACQKHS